ILDRLRFSNETIDQVVALVANHMRFMHAHKMNATTLKRFLRMERFDEHLALHRLDCLSSSGHLGSWGFVREQLRELPAEQLRPPRLITGNDLIAAGYTPGPSMKTMLTAVEDAQLEGTVSTREEALELVRSRFQP
ncbi:MAG TPA: CCA tRNA nucleotidyltransferase, partial [Bryobacteraceae bacterium]